MDIPFVTTWGRDITALLINSSFRLFLCISQRFFFLLFLFSFLCLIVRRYSIRWN